MANMDGHMKIRKTTEKDIERVMDIYAHARKFMAEHGNPNQWGKRNWPPEELIRDDIEQLVLQAQGRMALH